MTLQSYNDFVSRVASGYYKIQPIWDEIQTATTAIFPSPATLIQRLGVTQDMPSLPSGVTAYILTKATLTISGTPAVGVLLAKVINLGSLDISTPTFTDGSQMPTVTELGVSRQIASPVLVEVTTALNSAPGSLQITYKDQDNNTAESNSAVTLSTSAAVKSAGFALLNTGDWGVVDITSATRTGGTTPSGILQFWGLVPLSVVSAGASGTNGIYGFENLLIQSFNPVRLGANDKIMAFSIYSQQVRSLIGDLFFVGDN